MRVLVLSHSSAVDNLGGAERSMLEFIDSWRELAPALEVMVVTRSPEGFLQPELERRRIPWMMLRFESWVMHRRIIEDESIYRTATDDFIAVKALERLIREFGPDLVITNTIVVPWAAVAAKLVGVPHVWFAHEYGDDHEFAMTVDQTFEDLGMLSDLVVTSSQELRSYLSHWIDADKIDVLYPDLHLSDVEQLLAERIPAGSPFSDDETALRVVCVGRIAHSKGQARLVRAIAALKTEGMRVEAALVGTAVGDNLIEISALIAELEVEDRVVLTGEVANPYPYMAEADLGVVVSDSEGFGRATVEYMAAGKAVVAARAGATVELVTHRETGLLTAPGDVDDLAAALRVYWGDRGLVVEHGANARRVLIGEIDSRHPISVILHRLDELISRGSAPVERLPHLMMSWMTLPAIAMRMVETEMPDPRSSRSWRLGDALLVVPRRIRGRRRSVGPAR